MKISTLNQFNESKQLNTLDKNCLRNTDLDDYIDEDDSERYFSIEDNGIQVATIDACLSNEKAGLQITRMRTKENLEKQKEILKEFTNYV